MPAPRRLLGPQTAAARRTQQFGMCQERQLLRRRRTAQLGPLPTFMVTPADGRADQGTVTHASLPVMLTTGSRQFVEQHLCVLQIGGVEALGEPAVNGRQQLARFGPPTLFGSQLGEARHSA